MHSLGGVMQIKFVFFYLSVNERTRNCKVVVYSSEPELMHLFIAFFDFAD